MKGRCLFLFGHFLSWWRLLVLRPIRRKQTYTWCCRNLQWGLIFMLFPWTWSLDCSKIEQYLAVFIKVSFSDGFFMLFINFGHWNLYLWLIHSWDSGQRTLVLQWNHSSLDRKSSEIYSKDSGSWNLGARQACCSRLGWIQAQNC